MKLFKILLPAVVLTFFVQNRSLTAIGIPGNFKSKLGFSLKFLLFTSSFLNFNVVSATEVKGWTLSVFNSLSFSINSKIEFKSPASFSAFFSSTEILDNFDMCFIVLRSILIW